MTAVAAPLVVAEVKMVYPGKGRGFRMLATAARAWPSRVWPQRLFPAPAPDVGRGGRSFWVCLLTLLVLAGGMLLPNRSFPLFEPDEGRRAEIGREILANGRWALCT